MTSTSSPLYFQETKKYGAPQMQYSHSKTAFVEFLKSQMEQDVEYKPPVFDFTEDMDAEEVEAGKPLRKQWIIPTPGFSAPAFSSVMA